MTSLLQDAAPTRSVSQRAAWAAVAAAFALNGGLFGIWASRIPAFKDSYTLSHTALGVLLLLLAAGAICAFPVAGRLSDQIGAARLSRSLAIVNLVALVCLPLSPNVVVLGMVLFVFGAAHGAMDVSMNAWGAEVERWSARPQMSSFHAMWSLGAGLGAATGYLAVTVDAAPLLHFACVGTAAAVGLLWVSNIDWASATKPRIRGRIFTLPKGHLIVVGLLALGAALGEGAVADWSAVYLADAAQAPQQWAALGYAVFSVTMVALRLMGNQINKKAPPHIVVRVSGFIAAAGAVLTLVYPTLPTMLTGFALMGVGYALVIPLAFSRAANDPAVSPGEAIAGVATLSYGGMLLGPPLIGFVAGLTSLKLSFGLLALLALMPAGLSNVLRPSDD